MAATARNLPEGFVSTTSTSASGLVFQNASNWSKADTDGRMVQGTYLGRTDADQFGKKNYKFLSTTAGITIDKDGKDIEYPAGATVIINESGSLNKGMTPVLEGTEVIVDYNGMIKVAKGTLKGKSIHSYSVFAKA